MTRKPGEVRDAIIAYLCERKGREATISQIRQAVNTELGDVPPSSIRSYLRLNTPNIFRRTGHGKYQLVGKDLP